MELGALREEEKDVGEERGVPGTLDKLLAITKKSNWTSGQGDTLYKKI